MICRWCVIQVTNSVNMKNLLILLLPVFLISCGTRQTAKTQMYASAEEQAIYEVLNFCLNSNRIAKNHKLLADETTRYGSMLSGWPYANDDSRFFTQEDMAFMHTQEADSIPFTIETQKLSRPIKMASSEKLGQWLAESEKTGLDAYWDKVYAEYGGGYGTFTKPLFSKDYKTAVIAYGLHCGGLCGFGATYILRKGENGWQVVDVFNNWIS